MRLDKKVALITGAGTGLGAATALLFAQEGSKVVLMGRRKTVLRKVGKVICNSKRTAQVLVVPGDVSRWRDCEKVVKETLKEWGKINILVNNAGVGWGSAPHETSEKEWDRVMDINVKGAFFMTKAVVPSMLKRQAGSIVNISSILGLVAMPDCSAYNVSKGALIQLTRSTAS